MNIPSILKHKRIAVLYGGLSSERSISLLTGRAVLKALRGAGLDAVGVDAGRNLPEILKKKKIGYCYIALHGRFGEDGTVQGLCEMMGIPYSGSGVAASALCMDKALCKRVLQSSGVPTAPFIVVEKGDARPAFPTPCVVKPVDGGSALGVSIVRRSSQYSAALRLAFKYSKRAVVERFVQGREVTVSVLGDRALSVIEIVPKSTFYDFKSKYVKGMSNHILPARLSPATSALVRRYALAAHRALNCRAYSRVDFIVDRAGRPWALEVNTIPGMTETSLFPEAARAAGLSFTETVLEIARWSAAE